MCKELLENIMKPKQNINVLTSCIVLLWPDRSNYSNRIHHVRRTTSDYYLLFIIYCNRYFTLATTDPSLQLLYTVERYDELISGL